VEESKSKQRRILIIEPYYGGSHQAFLDGLCEYIPADYTLLTLPPRKWKMRMQLSSIWFAEEVKKIMAQPKPIDIVLSSTFLDLAVFRALVTGLPGWYARTRFYTYFHENQFAYPSRIGGKGHYHFQALNFTTAVVSDRIAFNSMYNMESFCKNCLKYLKKASDIRLLDIVDEIRRKSTILYPGLDFSELDALPTGGKLTVPVIMWNHRWEHDKNPEEFFSVLYTLSEEGVLFKLIIVGQSFRNEPQCFHEARLHLRDHILHWGYVESRKEYLCLLRQADIVVSTARQEFFGISIIEAVRAGCWPLLPKRLSYPELFAEKFLYRRGELTENLREILLKRPVLNQKERHALTQKYLWQVCKHQYERWLFSAD
jgi:glycosyltransferase involved in cell wall biosynthesis